MLCFFLLPNSQVRHLRLSLVPNLSLERDKLRSDLSESNQRAADLAQEIDEQNARTEDRAREQIRLGGGFL